MKRWGRTSVGRPQWRIGTEDCSDVLFPPNDRVRTLFRKHVAVRSDVTVLVRQSNSMVVEAAPGLTQHDCESFLRELWKETHFK